MKYIQKVKINTLKQNNGQYPYVYIMASESIDYLEVDKQVPGQSYVCLSFLSPEKLILQKNEFYVHSFLKSISKEYNKTQDELVSEYDQFLYSHKEELNEEFNTKVDFKTSVRGIKIRGTYSSLREAQVRAKVLQKIDDKFHVFVGQVGYWLPWDPNPDSVKDQEYQEDQLNQLMKKYDENRESKEEYYEIDKSEWMTSARFFLSLMTLLKTFIISGGNASTTDLRLQVALAEGFYVPRRVRADLHLLEEVGSR